MNEPRRAVLDRLWRHRQMLALGVGGLCAGIALAYIQRAAGSS